MSWGCPKPHGEPMPHFAILRMNKINNRSKLKSANAHNKRLIDVFNADPDKNIKSYIRSDPIKKLDNLIKNKNIKPRKNAVLACEFMLSFSPEHTELMKKFGVNNWVKANHDFFAKKYGKENILSVDLHLDESTPHVHIMLAPIIKKEKKNGQKYYNFDARTLFGGSNGKTKLSKLQDEYAEEMKQFGLERGLKNSKAKHKTIKKYYTDLNNELIAAEIRAEKIFDKKMKTEPSIFNFKEQFKRLKNLTKKYFKMTSQLKSKNSDLKHENAKLVKLSNGFMDEIKVFEDAMGTLDQSEALKALESAANAKAEQVAQLNEKMAQEAIRRAEIQNPQMVEQDDAPAPSNEPIVKPQNKHVSDDIGYG